MDTLWWKTLLPFYTKLKIAIFHQHQERSNKELGLPTEFR